jgi:CheY-like chemotaxis protein
VSVAHDGPRALEMATGLVPDVALLDIGLPGMDGYTLARRLRGAAATQHLRLIAVTGWGQDGDRARAREAGFDGHLTKPAEPSAILALLHQGRGSRVPGGEKRLDQRR